MKLLYCKKCHDIFALCREDRKCICGDTHGFYSDMINAEIYGEDAVPIGFANDSFLEAVVRQPSEGMGREFTAFVIPKHCNSITRF